MLSSYTFLSICLFLQLPLFIHAHGYLSSPPPRGMEKEAYQIDDLKSPNKKGLCRGEKEGKVTRVSPGGPLTLGFTITAPHTGNCVVSILNLDLRDEVKLEEKFDCAAPGKVEPWTVKLPSDMRGRKVLRWYWQGCHVHPCEDYEQCIDLDFGGGNDYEKPGKDGNDKVQNDSFDKGPQKESNEQKSNINKHDQDDDNRYINGRDRYEPNKNNNNDQDHADQFPPRVNPPTFGSKEYARTTRQTHAMQKQVDRMLAKKRNKHTRRNEQDPRSTHRGPPSVKSSSKLGVEDDNNEMSKYNNNEQYSQGPCQGNSMKCNGRNWLQCSYGKWTKMACSPGTHCKPTQNSIICG